MQENSFTNNLTIQFLCLMAFLFALVDLLELNKIYNLWTDSSSIKNKIFNDCLVYPLMARTIFTLFSLFSSISAMMLTFLISFNLEMFIDKFFLTYVYYNYYIFGPYMLIFSLVGLLNWSKIINICYNNEEIFSNYSNIQYNFLNTKAQLFSDLYKDNIKVVKDFPYEAHMSTTNMFNLITTMTISVIICLGMSLYETYNIFVSSIRKNDDGNIFIRKIFWYVVFKNRRNINSRQILLNENVNHINNNSNLSLDDSNLNVRNI